MDCGDDVDPGVAGIATPNGCENWGDGTALRSSSLRRLADLWQGRASVRARAAAVTFCECPSLNVSPLTRTRGHPGRPRRAGVTV